jgi:hypothetical protein
MGLPGGFYDVQLRDPRGNVSTLSGGFQSLGPDHDAPIVTITTPVGDSVVAAGTDVPVDVQADDGVGHLATLACTLTWRGSAPMTPPCAIPIPVGAAQAPCTFSFTAPTLDLVVDSMTITCDAVDTQGNRGTAVSQIWVGLQPSVDTFAPSAGPTAGGTNIYVFGTDFINLPGSPGTTEVLIGGLPLDPFVVDSPRLMHGSIPAHDPGTVPLVVKTGDAMIVAGFFDYVATPNLRVAYPQSGPAIGGTPIEIAGDHFRPTGTHIQFGTAPQSPQLVCPTFVSEHLITGLTPPGTGTAEVVATDTISGQGSGSLAFSYIGAAPGTATDGGAADADAGDAAEAGAPAPACPPVEGGTP